MNFSDSLGKCKFCERAFSRSIIVRHLESCEKRLTRRDGRNAKHAAVRNSFVLFVEGRRSPEYWIVVEIPADATLKKLDAFLRRAWLECCGHLSAFTINGKKYQSDEETAMEFNEKVMDVKLSDVLSSGLKFYHEYDFGSTTELALKAVSEHPSKAAGKEPVVLARNDKLKVPCESCGVEATGVCAYCVDDAKGWCCKKCSKKHKCGEEAMLPAVNSPRVGTCGYRGKPY